MIATTPIQKVVLVDSISQQAYTFVNGEYMPAIGRIKGWYQLLSGGSAMLFKKINKQMQEVKPYGSATVEQTIVTSPRYYVLYKVNLTEIKKIKELSDVLVDKRDEVSQFVKNNNLSGKTENDFITLINYYNSLK
jgi:hypothetical protein